MKLADGPTAGGAGQGAVQFLTEALSLLGNANHMRCVRAAASVEKG
jgi:hypothetical protein